MEPKKDRHWLVFRDSITTDMRQGAAGKAIISYMEEIGFHQTQTSPSMIFTRGAALAGFYNQSPASQQTEVTVDVIGSGSGNTIVEVKLRVNCLGNLPLRPDIEFWQAELVGLGNALRFGYADPQLSYFAAERARWFNITIMMSIMLTVVSLMLLVVVGFLALTRIA